MKKGWTDWSIPEDIWGNCLSLLPQLIYLLKGALKIRAEEMSIFDSLCPDIKM